MNRREFSTSFANLGQTVQNKNKMYLSVPLSISVPHFQLFFKTTKMELQAPV